MKYWQFFSLGSLILATGSCVSLGFSTTLLVFAGVYAILSILLGLYGK